MKFSIEFTHDGVEQKVTTAPVDIVAFERAYAVSMAKAFNPNDMSMEHMSWLAWHAAKRTGKTSTDYNTWLNGLEDIFNEPEPIANLSEGPSPA